MINVLLHTLIDRRTSRFAIAPVMANMRIMENITIFRNESSPDLFTLLVSLMSNSSKPLISPSSFSATPTTVVGSLFSKNRNQKTLAKPKQKYNTRSTMHTIFTKVDKEQQHWRIFRIILLFVKRLVAFYTLALAQKDSRKLIKYLSSYLTLLII